MKTIFSTADVRPRDRFDSWHAAAQQYIIDHDSRPDCRLTFEAKLCSVALDEMTLVSLESSPMTVSHTSRHVAQATPTSCSFAANSPALCCLSRTLAKWR
jgi:AraC family transcriptional activator of tynA and feaB